MKLYEINNLMNEIEKQLENHEVEINQELVNQVNALNEDFNEQFENFIERIKHLESEKEYLKKRSDDIKKMAQSVENKINRYKEFLMFLMDNRKMEKFKGKHNTANIIVNKNGSLKVESEDAIPSDFFEPVEPKLNKSELKKYILDGNEVEGCFIDKSRYLKL